MEPKCLSYIYQIVGVAFLEYQNYFATGVESATERDTFSVSEHGDVTRTAFADALNSKVERSLAMIPWKSSNTFVKFMRRSDAWLQTETK